MLYTTIWRQRLKQNAHEIPVKMRKMFVAVVYSYFCGVMNQAQLPRFSFSQLSKSALLQYASEIAEK